MFEPNPHSSCEFSIRLRPLVVKERPCSISNPFLITQNLAHGRPLIRDLAMSMTVLWVVNIGVDATFKDVAVRARLGGCIAGCSCQINVQEGRNVAQVEEATVSKLDGLRK